MSVNEQVLDAIELLMKNSVERAGYDKTIQAQIISCEDPAIGKYKCRFQDAVFYAYTGNTEITLSNGTYVYILVPENDMAKDKTILGTIDKLGTNYVNTAVGDQAYNIIGNNCIKTTNSFYLDTNNKNYNFNIYEYGVRDLVDLDIQGLNQYIKNSSSLIIGAKIKTQIDSTRQYQGHYGISFVLEFLDDDGNIIQRTYTVNEDNMVDNPYNLIYPTRQYAIYDIDSQHFNKVKSIAIFNSDFPNATGNTTTGQLISGDITLSELQLKCAARMSEEELNGLALTFFTPNGTLFLTSTDSPKIIQALVKVKGKVVTSTDDIDFYYGIEDVGVTSKSEYYNKNLGSGWHCLNNFNVIQGRDANEQSFIQWIPHNDTFTFSFEQATAADNRLKIAAIYDGNVITKQINIQNLTQGISSIQIISTNGTKFFYGNGVTNLICTAEDVALIGVAQIDYARIASASGSSINGNYTYKWAWQNNGGLLEPIEGLSNDFIQSIDGNMLTNVQIRKIYNFGIFKCSVYRDGIYIGTGSINIVNSTQGEGVNPLNIINGTMLFKYNEKGVAPNSKSFQKPQIIPSLSFVLYDDTGNEINIIQNGLVDINAKVQWAVPKNDTLLIIPNSYPSFSDDDYNYYNNQATLTYDIASRYDATKTNNQIKLYVVYNGSISVAETAFTFTKQGNIGTNGTEYYIKIIPNTLLQSPPEFPMITKLGSSQRYALNYGLSNGNQQTIITSSIVNQNLLKVQIWHSDQKVYETGWSGNIITPTIEWSILKNHYWGSGVNSVDDDSDFSIDATTGALTYTNSLQNGTNLPKANIIKCSITYEDKTYYGTIPFITAYVTNQNYRIQLKNNTGFHYVVYSSDGMSPEYDNRNPFEFIFKNNNEQIIDNIIYTASIKGNTKYKQNNIQQTRDSNNLQRMSIRGLQANQFRYQPSSRYFGECVNNSIQCSCQQSSTFVGIINVPIHFLLNKYGLGNINQWDGNSVQIDQDEGYILAPQMGAGKKENDNSFTGVLMGEVKNPMKNKSDIGLLGYHSGDRTFFLNSENGSAIFGSSSNGQIIIDPTADKSVLYSANFWNNYNAQTGLPSSYNESNYANAGMLIDLTTPQIIFKNKMLWLTSNGAVYAGKRIEGSSTYYNFSVDANGNVALVGSLKAGRISGTGRYNFEVDSTTGAMNLGYSGGSYNFTVDSSGNVTMKGAVTANSGKIGGSSGWTIGSDTNRGYIYSGNRNSLDSTASGLYVGTDGISAYKSGTGITFKVDSSGNVIINGSITMGSGSSISWSVLQDAGAVNSQYVNSAIDDAIDDLDIPVLPSYIKSTYIDSTTIESPTIYAGKYYATGDGRGSSDSGAAYYIYDGLPTQSGSTKVGYISYDSDGSGLDESQHRVKFRTVGATALKIQSGLDLSIQTGAWNDNADAALNNYQIYLMSQTSFDRAIFLREETSGTGIWRTYGDTLPSESAMGWQSTGRLFFLLD